jgi:hypothetical protein
MLECKRGGFCEPPGRAGTRMRPPRFPAVAQQSSRMRGMSSVAPYGGRLLLAMVAGVMLSTLAAEARHWRHYEGDRDRARAQSQLPGGENGLFRGGAKFPSLQRAERAAGSIRPPENAGRRPETIGFGSAIGQLIEGCQRQVTEFKKLPFEGVARTIQPNDDQRGKLEAMRETVNNAADTLAVVCPKALQGGLGEKLAILSHSLVVRVTRTEGTVSSA